MPPLRIAAPGEKIMWVQLFGALVVGLLQPLLTSELQQLVAQVKAKVPTLVDPDGHIAIAALIPLVLSEIEALVHAKSNSFVAMIVNSILGPLAANELPALEAIVKALDTAQSVMKREI